MRGRPLFGEWVGATPLAKHKFIGAEYVWDQMPDKVHTHGKHHNTHKIFVHHYLRTPTQSPPAHLRSRPPWRHAGNTVWPRMHYSQREKMVQEDMRSTAGGGQLLMFDTSGRYCTALTPLLRHPPALGSEISGLLDLPECLVETHAPLHSHLITSQHGRYARRVVAGLWKFGYEEWFSFKSIHLNEQQGINVFCYSSCHSSRSSPFGGVGRHNMGKR